MPDRILKGFQAVNEAITLCMAADPSVYVMGLGVPDPKGVFGTTSGLKEKFGDARVMDMPTAENGMTGVAIGSALAGMRPILVHQRLDFALLSLEQIVNQAAKWHYMFGGKKSVPMVVRMIIGRGWGQGPQHSQSLQSWFAHVPGLKVVMAAFPYDQKGLLVASIEDPNPVVFIEHRWNYEVSGHVPAAKYSEPIGKAKIVRGGGDVTIAAVSYMTFEAVRAAELLAEAGVQAEVVDVRTLRPLDEECILESARKTGRFICADTGSLKYGVTAELSALVAERAFDRLKCAPRRIGLPDVPSPTSPALAKGYYPGAYDIAVTAAEMCRKDPSKIRKPESKARHDVPDPSFSGPF